MNKKITILALVALMTLTVLSYWPSLNNGFVYWDDFPQIVNNAAFTEAKPTQAIKQIFSTQIVGMYQPVSGLYYYGLYRIFGPTPFAFHLSSLFLHLIIIVLVFCLLASLIGQAPALAATAIFALHPAQVESVAWISASSNLLASLFILLSLIGYRKYLRNNRTRDLMLASALGVTAMFAKPIAIILPLLWLLAEWYDRGKIRKDCLWKNKLTLWTCALLIGLATVIARMTAGHFIESYFQYAWSEKIILVLDTLINYLYLAMWPIGLSPFYPYPLKINGSLTIATLLSPLLAVGLACLIWRYRRHRGLILAMAWFVINLALVVRFKPVGRLYLADRYLYLPLIAPAGLIALALHRLPRKFALPILAIIIVSLSALCLKQTAVWQNDITIHTAAIERYPDHPEISFVYDNLANALIRQGRADEALVNLDRALALNPELAASYNNRGLVYLSFFHQPTRALDDFRKAISLNADWHIYHFNYAVTLSELGRPREALLEINQAIKLNKSSPANYFCRRSLIKKKLGDEQGARDDLETAEKFPAPAISSGQAIFIKSDCPQ